MNRRQIEEKLRHAVYQTEEEFPPETIGLLLLGAVPLTTGGFQLHQVGNVPVQTARNILLAALRDIDAGKGEIKEKL
jgi:hypothetical protein